MKYNPAMAADGEVLKSGIGILKDFIRKHRWRYIGGFLMVLVINGLTILAPILTGRLVDEIKNAANSIQDLSLRRLAILCSLFVIISLVSLLANFLARLLYIGTSNMLDYLLRTKLFHKLMELSMRFYNRFSTGDIMALATNDLPALYRALGMGTMMLSNALFLLLVSVFYLMTRMSVRLTLFLIIPFPLMIFVMVKFGKLIHTRFLRVQESFSDVNSKAEENISGIRVVKSFVQEENETGHFRNINQENYKANIALARIHALFHPILILLGNAPYLIVLVVGGFQVMEGIISLGDYVAVNSFIGLIVQPMAFLGMIINFVQRGKVSLMRVSKLLFAKADIYDGKFGNTLSMDDERLSGRIEFRNLTFSYGNGTPDILNNISFTIEPGETVAILGTVGSGKSTIASLLTRTWDLESKGQIFLDGKDIIEIPLRVLRDNIAYVPQGNILFSETIRYNIGFSPKPKSDDEIEEAARISAVYNDIMEFPDQFNTMLGEKGVNLSGGQKQRICIARAVSKNAPIMILDDSLSSVDIQTEKEIQRNLREVRKGRTCIIIAHRISTIKDADKIVLFDGGRLEESGTHEELMAKKGLYCRMYNLQLIEEMEA